MSPPVLVLFLLVLLPQLLALTLTLELQQQAAPLHHHPHHHHPMSQLLVPPRCRRLSSAQRFDDSAQALVTDAVQRQRAANPQHLVSAPQNEENQPWLQQRGRPRLLL